MEGLILRLREILTDIMKRDSTPFLLFSGGLDTSILAGLNPSAVAITVSLESSGEDILYAESMAKQFGLSHHHRIVTIEEALGSIPNLIKILESFDPAIPNDLVVYFGLSHAEEMGAKAMMTGDGADELFAGYDYMREIENLTSYLTRITASMSFNSNRLGDFFMMRISQPYLDKELIQFALNIPLEFKIREEEGKVLGKWILRKAFEANLPKEIIWQSKRPLEYGSGMSRIREIITQKMSDEEWLRKTRFYPVKFMNPEHLYYYEIYREVVGDIPKPKENEKECPYCGGGMGNSSFHCRICGGVLNWKI
ncbi:MAG: asparagine synthase [Deltaproteobacteria bacterium]|nr:asparagine synthase [Deltaproteobacteria bacterium]